MLLKDLYIFFPQPLTIWCYKLDAIALASKPIFHASTKHIEVNYYFIREKVLSHEIQIKFISSLERCANIFSKV